MACIVEAARPRAKEAMLANEHLRKAGQKKEEESWGCLNSPQRWWFWKEEHFLFRHSSTNKHNIEEGWTHGENGPHSPELRLRPGSLTDYRSCDVSFAIWSPLTPSLSPQKWTLRGGSSNNFIHICVRHEHIGFCLLNLWLTFLRVIKSCVYEWTAQSKDTRPHPAAIP